MLKAVGFFCMAVCSGSFAIAQQAVSADKGGGNKTGSAVSLTTEKTNYTSSIGNSGAVTEGVNKAYEINVVNRLDPGYAITLECEVNPTPAADFLILKINREEIENMKYQLIDMNGKVIEEAFIGGVETSISLRSYKPKKYQLKVFDNSEEIKLFNIIKTKQP